MYKNVGAKIKALATVFLALWILVSVITGITVIAVNEYLVWVGIAVILIGSAMGWLAGIMVYAYGELVDRTTKIEMLLRLSAMSGPVPSAEAPSRSSSEIFCKKCGTKYDLSAGTICPSCGCDNHR